MARSMALGRSPTYSRSTTPSSVGQLLEFLEAVPAAVDPVVRLRLQLRDDPPRDADRRSLELPSSMVAETRPSITTLVSGTTFIRKLVDVRL